MMSAQASVVLCFLLTFSAVFIHADKLFRIKVKKIRCEHVDPNIYNGTLNCFIKPTRDGIGNTTIGYFYGKPAYDLHTQIKVYYRYTGGWRPFMIDIDIDVGEPNEWKSSNVS